MEQRVFDFAGYKEFLNRWIRAQPQGGRGEVQRLSKELRMHPTRVSQILHQDSVHFTPEQAHSVSAYLELSEIESEYFRLLVDVERAGTLPLRKAIAKKIAKIKTEAQELVNRVPRDVQLSEADKAVFYSNWYYSAIRMCTSIPELQTIDAIARRSGLPKEKVRQTLQFLIETGLCVFNENHYEIGPSRTYLESSSPLIQRHHANWRLKAMQNHEHLKENDLAYTGVMSLSVRDRAKVRESLAKVIESTASMAVDSPSETGACLLIDWFEF